MPCGFSKSPAAAPQAAPPEMQCEHCWLQSSFPHALSPGGLSPSQPLVGLAGQAVDAADGGAAGTAAAGIDTASGADIGVEFVWTARCMDRRGGRAPSGPTSGVRDQ